jgi:hypothetical protein
MLQFLLVNVRSGFRSCAFALTLGVLLASTLQASHAQGLVSWWPGNGNYQDVVSGNNGMPFGGVGFAPAVYGEGFSFTGNGGRIFVPDVPSLAITGSMAITAWVKLTSVPAQDNYILFRGDDRGGFDPYWLGVSPGGYPAFEISDDADNAAELYSLRPLPLNRFVFVAATLDSSAFNEPMSLYVNGRLVDWAIITVRPFGDLDPTANPGVGIGNTQSSTDDQMFPGVIDDLKIYNTANPTITPTKLTLNHSKVKGGATVKATLKLNDSPITPAYGTASSTLSAATVPGTVTVEAGYYSVTFDITTKSVKSSQSGTIAVVLNGTTLTATLTVTP